MKLKFKKEKKNIAEKKEFNLTCQSNNTMSKVLDLGLILGHFGFRPSLSLPGIILSAEGEVPGCDSKTKNKTKELSLRK